MAIWVLSRRNFDNPVIRMLRSCPITCAFKDSTVSRPHTWTPSGIMPIALMTWALRAIDSACRFALVP
jgi:hypothetical protein